ncbi:hypothetical protein B9W68_23355 [Streptomyces sp. CS227]|nr:hypothetical protein B9W68_23355 [Streptomyces sp. CS227]
MYSFKHGPDPARAEGSRACRSFAASGRQERNSPENCPKELARNFCKASRLLPPRVHSVPRSRPGLRSSWLKGLARRCRRGREPAPDISGNRPASPGRWASADPAGTVPCHDRATR